MLGLGIDGGGSATRWALCDETGAVVDAGELPGISGHLFNAPERARFADMAGAMRARLGGAEICGVVAGITGMSEPEVAASIMSEAFGIPAASVQVRDDMWIAYHAVFAPGEGHIVYAGTGSIGVHVCADGSMLRVGGRGMLIDDGGSAFWIGRTALDLVWRRIDDDPDAGSKGRLAQEIFLQIGCDGWDATRAYVYGGGRAAVAALARAVAAADDADARAILHAAGAELARMARSLARRAGKKPVALIGRAAALHAAILDGFRAAAPDLAVRLEAPDAAVAAARLAITSCGAGAPRAP
jgi:glucosamine kinase